MAVEISLDEYKLAYREIKTEEEKRGFLIHLVAYLLVNAMLFGTNLIYTVRVIWFIYPLFFWGIGITAHYLGAVRWIESNLKDKEAKAEYRAREARRK